MSETKTNPQDVLRSEIDAEVTDLSVALAAHLNIDKDTGTVEFDDSYVDTLLGEEFTLEQKRRLDKRITLAADATHLAVGELAVDAFKANKDLQRVTGTTPFGGAHIDVDIQRTNEVRNVSTQEVTTAYLGGATRVLYKKPTSKASFKRVRSYLKSLGEEELG